jgi:hypothetical protein
MIEILTSDPAILLISGLGLAVTAISIARDTRAQRANAAPDELLPEQLRDAA